MKKGTVFGIFLAVISLILLGLLALYLSMTFRAETFFADSVRMESEADAAMQALYASQFEQETAASTELPDAAPVIWVGDSRTLGMQNALTDPGSDLFIGASGEGYTWFSQTGLPLLKEAIHQEPDAPVVFNFGVNDYDNLSRYLTLYTELTEEYPDTTFYFLSVNPIEPTLCSNISNEEIADFNQHLKETFPETYLDSFTMLMIDQAVTIDGIHYSEEDYLKIYDFVRSQILTK